MSCLYNDYQLRGTIFVWMSSTLCVRRNTYTCCLQEGKVYEFSCLHDTFLVRKPRQLPEINNLFRSDPW
jgi:hypothetical protein